MAFGEGGVPYGVTQEGGGTGCNGQGCGILYQLTPPAVAGGSWTETSLHAFANGADGRNPQVAHASDSSGTLFGFAYGGTGTCFSVGCGVVYQDIP